MPPLKVFLFLSLVESFFMVYVGTKIIKLPITPKQLFLAAFLNASMMFLMRHEKIWGHLVHYGIHSFIIVAGLSVVLGLILKLPFRITFVSAALSMIFIILSDSVILTNVMHKYGMIPVNELPNHPWRWIVYGLCSDGILIATAIFLKLTDKCLFPAPGINRDV